MDSSDNVSTEELKRLETQLKTLEAALQSRDVEINSLLADNQILIEKLDDLGVCVRVGDHGLEFFDPQAPPSPETPRGTITPPEPKVVAKVKSPVAVPGSPTLSSSSSSPVVTLESPIVVTTSPKPRNRSSKVLVEAAAARSDMQTLLQMSIDDLLGLRNKRISKNVTEKPTHVQENYKC